MAKLENEEQNPADDEVTLTPEELEEALAPKQEETPPTGESTNDEDELPEKYRGKSIKEIVAMHQAAEKKMGQQSGEVGELRSIVDEFIQNQTATGAGSQQSAPSEGPQEVDFFEDPEGAVSKAIDNHPKVVAAANAAENLGRQSAAQAINEKHPDAGTIVKDPAFAAFVKESPIRRELFARADAKMDVAAADELLTAFKQRQGTAQAAAEADKADRERQLSAANTGNAKGSVAQQGKRIYRRADIIRLMKEKPDRYEALAPEIQLAYAEGRVR